MRFTNVIILCLPLALTGCTLSPTTAPTSVTSVKGSAFHGVVHGGQQPIVGAHIYLYAAGAGGYGTASTSLLNSNVATYNPGYYGQDGSGNYYVITDANGAFSISSDYTCTSGAGIYLYSVGGNSGGGANSAIGLMAVLGDCPAVGNFASATPFVMVNEVSTIAAAYAMAGFATDATHVSSSGTALAQTGVRNAFANAANLANISTGLALTTTPTTNGPNIGTVPQATINTLANILAACINSTGSTACSTLFSNAMSAGSSGTTATDTATAAINMAHNPQANNTALYNLSVPSPPFEPALTYQPNDFTLSLSFTGFGLSTPVGIAIDASGNAWVANANGNSVSEFTSAGAVATGSPFTGGGMRQPIYIAIDGSGNVWVTNQNDCGSSVSGYGCISEFNSSGSAISGSNGYNSQVQDLVGLAIDGSGNVWVANQGMFGSTSNILKLTSTNSSLGSGTVSVSTYSAIGYPSMIAIDGSGNVWVTNGGSPGSLLGFTNAGGIITGSPFIGGGLDEPQGIAIDGSNDVWTANTGNNSLSKFDNTGKVLSVSGYTGGGLASPLAIAIDGGGNAWVGGRIQTTYYESTLPLISEFANTGAAISNSSGIFINNYGNHGQIGGIAVDGSGNVWVVNSYNSISELIGAGKPVVTPIAANLISPYTHPASEP
jgi:hypothetical protein